MKLQIFNNFQYPIWEILVQQIPFGMNVGGNVFQCEFDVIFSNLNFVAAIADDMVI